MLNRRGFLTQLFQTAGGILVTPSIVTHGLKLRPALMDPDYALMHHKFESMAFRYLGPDLYTLIMSDEFYNLMERKPFPPNMGNTIRSV